MNVKDLEEERKMKQHRFMTFDMDKVSIFFYLLISINKGIALHWKKRERKLRENGRITYHNCSKKSFRVQEGGSFIWHFNHKNLPKG